MKKIESFSNEYHFLSNFYICDVPYLGEIYRSAEHAYQSAKTINKDQHDAIKNCKTPAMAKKLAKYAEIRSDWNDIKYNIMIEIVYSKFIHNDRLALLLINTHDYELIEGNTWNDYYWGICNNIGENNLGKILMSVRNVLIKDQNEYCT